MILGKWPTWRTSFMYLFIFLTFYMFRAHRTHHPERQIVSIHPLVALILCQWPCRVQVGSSLPTCTRHGHLHSDSYQRLYWHNLSILMMSTSCSSSGETNCVNTTSGSSHSVSVAMSCAGRKWTSDLHTTWPLTQNESYQRLYWHNLSLRMMSTMCSKHVES